MAVTITSDTRRYDHFIEGRVDEALFGAKVLDKPSPNGIKGGRVVYLSIAGGGGVIARYERGWDIRPITPKEQAMVDKVVRKMDSMPVAPNAMEIKSKVLKNALGVNAAYNPQIAYDAWNRKILHGMAGLHRDAKTIEKILAHNLTQELNPMDKVDNDRLLNKVRGLIVDVEKLMAKY